MSEITDAIHLFDPLFEDIDTQAFFQKKPLLAHYTSLRNLESILKSTEIWFSNPLFMNDFEEVRFGLLTSDNLILNHPAIKKACGSLARSAMLFNALNSWSTEYISKYLADTYVFCLSEHERGDEDGLLSMWRGYGGNGNGAAIVFDTSQLTTRPESPLLFGEVKYASANERRLLAMQLADRFAELLSKANLPDEKLHLAAYALFERIKLFALFTKHQGFHEEREWRVVYMRDRDINNLFAGMLHYLVGDQGIQPKLRFKVEPIANFSAPDLSLSKIVERILLGPSLSSPLAQASVLRMLENLGHSKLKDRVFVSRIPFRPV